MSDNNDDLDQEIHNDKVEKQDEPTINLTLSDLGSLSDESVADIKENTGIIDTGEMMDELSSTSESDGMFDVDASPDVGDMMASLESTDLIASDSNLNSNEDLDNSTVMLEPQEMGIDLQSSSDVQESQENEEDEKIFLQVENLEMKGHHFPLADGAMSVVGRESGDIVLNHRSISSSHCTFTNQGGIVSITDNGSTNGTYINNEKIRPRRMVILEETDQIQLGQIVLSLNFDSVATPAQESTPSMDLDGGFDIESSDNGLGLDMDATSNDNFEVETNGDDGDYGDLSLDVGDAGTSTGLEMDSNLDDSGPVELQEATSTQIQGIGSLQSSDDLDADEQDIGEDLKTDLFALQQESQIEEGSGASTKSFNINEHLKTPEELLGGASLSDSTMEMNESDIVETQDESTAPMPTPEFNPEGFANETSDFDDNLSEMVKSSNKSIDDDVFPDGPNEVKEMKKPKRGLFNKIQKKKDQELEDDFDDSEIRETSRLTVAGEEELVGFIPRLIAFAGDMLLAFILTTLMADSPAFKLFLSDTTDIINGLIGTAGFIDESLMQDFNKILEVYLVYGVLRIIFTLLLGVSLFQLLTGLNVQGNYLKVRIMGAVREIVGFVLGPIIIGDALALAQRKTLKEQISLTTLNSYSVVMRVIGTLLIPIMAVVLVLSPYASELTNTQKRVVQELKIFETNKNALASYDDFSSKRMHFITSYLKPTKGFHIIPVNRTVLKNQRTMFIPGVATYYEVRKKAAYIYLEKGNPLKNMIKKAIEKGHGLSARFQPINTLVTSSGNLLKPSSTIQLGERVLDKSIMANIEVLLSEAVKFNKDKFISMVTGFNKEFASIIEFRNLLFKEFEVTNSSKFYFSKIGDSKFFIIQNIEKNSVDGKAVEYLIPIDSINGYVYKVESDRGKDDIMAMRDLYNYFLTNAKFEFDTVFAGFPPVPNESQNHITDTGILFDNFRKSRESEYTSIILDSYREFVKRTIEMGIENDSYDADYFKYVSSAFRINSNYVNFLRKKFKTIDDYYTSNNLRTSSEILRDRLKDAPAQVLRSIE